MSLNFARGETLYSLARYAEARKAFARAATEDPDFRAEATAEMARIDLIEGRVKEAARLAREAVGLAPESENVLVLSVLVLSAEHPEEAQRLALALLRVAPESASAFSTAAFNSRRRRRPREAVDYARRGLMRDPRHEECLRIGALAALDDLQPELARDWAARLLAIAPECPRAHALAAEVAADPSLAQAHLRARLARNPDAGTAFELMVGELHRTRWWRWLIACPQSNIWDHWPRLVACLLPSLALKIGNVAFGPAPFSLHHAAHPFTLLLAWAIVVIGSQPFYAAWRSLVSAEARRLSAAVTDYLLPAFSLTSLALVALMADILGGGLGARGLVLWLLLVAAIVLAARQCGGWRAMPAHALVWLSAAAAGVAVFSFSLRMNLDPAPGFIALNAAAVVFLFVLSRFSSDDKPSHEPPPLPR